jgi:RNA polymerase sigma factor (sigma-70 family)
MYNPAIGTSTGACGIATRTLAGHSSLALPGTEIAKVEAVADDVLVRTSWDWDEIVRTHSARVYRLAYRLTGNQHDAEDLTQDVFVRVFRSLSTYTPGTFEGWLHHITTNLFLDQVRRNQHIRLVQLTPNPGDRLGGREPTPAEAFDTHTLDGDVQTALDALAPNFRTTVVLRDIEGLSHEEIAATLGIKLGTVRSRLHGSRVQLRVALTHRAPLAAGRIPSGDIEGNTE